MIRTEDLILVGRNTREVISLGPGCRHWQLMDFQGPVFSADRVGGPSGRHHLFLPKALLGSLYERFASANPAGVLIGDIDDLMGDATAPELDDAERERQFDAGELWWDVFDWRIPPHGNDPIRRYLPELFDPVVLQPILDDPRLDMSQGPPSSPTLEQLWEDKSRHYRWSSLWNQR